MTFDYESESAKQRVLTVLNKGEQRIKALNQMVKTMEKELKSLRLDFVYCRTVQFGRGKGATGKQKNLHKKVK